MSPLFSWSSLRSPLRSWAAESQAKARRNAMTANTALTARRLEREEVDSYLRELELARRSGLAPGVPMDGARQAR